MEEEVVVFLKRILHTISLVLLWLMINSTAGIMYGYGFVEQSIKLGNVLFYVWLVVSAPLLLRHLLKKWKEQQPFDTN